MKRTKEVSELFGVSKRTLQYYDDEGILMVKRGPNHYRLYDDATLERIWQIMIYKEIGFELKQIKQMLDFPEIKKTQLQKQISYLQQQRECLAQKQRMAQWLLDNGMLNLPKDTAYATALKMFKQSLQNETEEK